MFHRAALMASVALGILYLSSIGSSIGRAEDWPGWRGPDGNGIAREALRLDAWPVGRSPKILWRASVGKGHSAITIRDGRAFTLGWDGQQDTVFCFDADTGAVRWRFSYASKTIVQWPGPRSTPAVDGQSVFTLGQHGQLHCLNATSGEMRWSVQLARSYQTDDDYGFAWSPLLCGELLILGTGSRGLALRKQDGTFAWGNDGKAGACVSPVAYQHRGQYGVVMVSMAVDRNSLNVVGVHAETGRELWRSAPWPEKWGSASADVVVHADKVFLTTAEQHKRCARFSFGNGHVKEDWSNRNLVSYTGSAVLIDGHLYGVDKIGALKCVDWESGAEKWSQRGFGEFGTLTASSNGHLIVQGSKDGSLIVVAADSGAYRELRREKIFGNATSTFTVPVLANGRIYCRSYAGEVVCLSPANPPRR